MFPMQAHTKISLACIARPYIDLVWKVGLLGLSPRGITFSPFFRFCWIPPSCLSSFSLLYKYFLPVPLPRVSFFFLWGRYSSYQSIRQSGWEKLDSMVWSMGLSGTGLHIMVLAVFSLVLLLYCSCIEFVLFFRRFHETLDVRSSSAISLGLQGASLRVLGGWALSNRALGP